MAHAKEKISPDQSALFQLPSAGQDVREGIRTWQDDPIPEVCGPEGSYVNIADRAQRLIKALGAISERNQRIGFGDAVTIPQYKPAIYERYTDQTENRIEQAERNKEDFASEIKREFWESTGIPSMKKAGLISEDEYKTHGRKFWRHFHDEFGGTGKQFVRARNNQIKLHTKQLENVRKINKTIVS